MLPFKELLPPHDLAHRVRGPIVIGSCGNGIMSHKNIVGYCAEEHVGRKDRIVSGKAAGHALLKRLPPGVHSVVSPHPDDAALSVGGTLAMIAALPSRQRLDLITVFTRSVYAPGLDDGTRTEAVVSAVRLREEARFAAEVNAELHVLDLPDASLRGYDDETERGAVLDEDRAPDLLASRLCDVTERLRPTVLWCPLALGGHVDHVLVRDAVVAIARKGMNLVFYEDVPYAAEIGEDALLSYVRVLSFDMEPVLIDISDVWRTKLSLLRGYLSQLGPQDRMAVERVASCRAGLRGGRGERLWIVR